ncbi:MAG: hypothetical protein AAFR21_06155 [Pseudomonadota bacterium]
MFGKRTENILVVKPDTLSGFIAAEPAFEQIRAAHPDAKISLLTTKALQRVARAAPYFDQVASMPDFKDTAARQAFVKQIKSAKFSRVYDLAVNNGSKKLQSAIGPFGPKWYSADPPAKPPKGEIKAMRPDFGRIMKAAGGDVPERRPDFSWTLAARKDSANMKPAWFGISGAFGLLLPGVEDGRRWTATGYGNLAGIMARSGIMPVLCGPKDLHGFGDDVAHIAPEVVDLTGKTDHLQLSALAREALFFVSDHADEAHLATAVGCSGVLIKKAGEEALVPEGRNVIVLTTRLSFNEAEPTHVWQALGNLGLLPREDALGRAATR